MKKVFVSIVLLISAQGFAGSTGQVGSGSIGQAKALKKCLSDYALNKVEEHNLPNESLLAANGKGLDLAIESISSMGYKQSYVDKAVKILSKAQAVGLVIQYMDEVQLIYVGVSIENGKCQVKQAMDVNTADISYGKKTKSAAVFFLGLSKKQLYEALGRDSTIGDIYDAVTTSLE